MPVHMADGICVAHIPIQGDVHRPLEPYRHKLNGGYSDIQKNGKEIGGCAKGKAKAAIRNRGRWLRANLLGQRGSFGSVA